MPKEKGYMGKKYLVKGKTLNGKGLDKVLGC
jgi:hypothetical protein